MNSRLQIKYLLCNTQNEEPLREFRYHGPVTKFRLPLVPKNQAKTPIKKSLNSFPQKARSKRAYQKNYPNLASKLNKSKTKRITADQTSILEYVYKQTAFPSTTAREDLAKRLGLSPRKVQIWFQNKRQVEKRNFNL